VSRCGTFACVMYKAHMAEFCKEDETWDGTRCVARCLESQTWDSIKQVCVETVEEDAKSTSYLPWLLLGALVVMGLLGWWFSRRDNSTGEQTVPVVYSDGTPTPYRLPVNLPPRGGVMFQ
jgi:hypothetical protein